MKMTPNEKNIQTMGNRRNEILAFLLQSEKEGRPKEEDTTEGGDGFEGVPFSVSAFSSPTISPSRLSHYSIAGSLSQDDDEKYTADENVINEQQQPTFSFPFNGNVSSSFEANLNRENNENDDDDENQSSHGFFAAWGHEHSNINHSNFSNYGYNDDEEYNLSYDDIHESQNKIIEGGGGGEEEERKLHTSRTDALYLHSLSIQESRRLKLEEQDSDLTFMPQLSTSSHKQGGSQGFERLIEDAQRKSNAQAQVCL